MALCFYIFCVHKLQALDSLADYLETLEGDTTTQDILLLFNLIDAVIGDYNAKKSVFLTLPLRYKTTKATMMWLIYFLLQF